MRRPVLTVSLHGLGRIIGTLPDFHLALDGPTGRRREGVIESFVFDAVGVVRSRIGAQRSSLDGAGNRLGRTGASHGVGRILEDDVPSALSRVASRWTGLLLLHWWGWWWRRLLILLLQWRLVLLLLWKLLIVLLILLLLLRRHRRRRLLIRLLKLWRRSLLLLLLVLLLLLLLIRHRWWWLSSLRLWWWLLVVLRRLLLWVLLVVIGKGRWITIVRITELHRTLRGQLFGRVKLASLLLLKQSRTRSCWLWAAARRSHEKGPGGVGQREKQRPIELVSNQLHSGTGRVDTLV